MRTICRQIEAILDCKAIANAKNSNTKAKNTKTKTVRLYKHFKHRYNEPKNIEHEIILPSVEINRETIGHIGILAASKVAGGDESYDPEDEGEEERTCRQHKALRLPQELSLAVAGRVGQLIFLRPIVGCNPDHI